MIGSNSDPQAVATLPAGPDYRGWWGEFSGSASGTGVSGDGGVALESALAVGANVRYTAWSDTRNGSTEIYVARQSNGVWEQLGGSASFGGVSGTLTQSRRPSIVEQGGAPVVAWTEIAANGASNIKVARWNGSAWVAMGESLDADGVSNTGTADDVQLLVTTTGVVAVWTDRTTGTPQVHARRFDSAASSWVALGGSVAVTSFAQGVTEVAAATDGTKVAVAWVQGTGDAAEIRAREFSGAAWTQLADASNNAGPSRTPSIAYFDGALFAAWRDQTSGREEIYVQRYASGTWSDTQAGSDTGTGVSATTGRAFSPKLQSGGGKLYLFWGDDSVQERPDNSVAFYVESYVNGTGFVEQMPGDASNRGVSPTRGIVTTLSAAVDASGRPFIAWNDARSGSPQVYLAGNLTAASRIFTANAANTVQNILDNFDLGTGDVIFVEAGSQAGFTLGGNDSGVTILGAPTQDATFTSAVTVNAGIAGTLQRLRFEGGVQINGAGALTVTDSIVAGGGGLVIAGGSDVQIVHNVFNAGATLRIATAAAGIIGHNTLSAGGTGLQIDAPFTGAIRDNDITGNTTGVGYNAAAELIGNRIFGNGTGVLSTIAGNGAFGFVGAATPNDIHDNATGVQLVAATVRNQRIHDNATGVSGSGLVGGDSLDFANLIEDNAIGIGVFTGTVQFNRIAGNDVGIAAATGDRIQHNLIYRNTETGVRVAGATDVRIYNNTMYAPSGDLIRLTGGASNVDVRNNVLWTEDGYDIYVANDSQVGFFSDYNNLYSSDAGKIGYWTRDFNDVLDWQADIARFDLHSIGRTAVNPQWAEPRFMNRGQDDFRLLPVAAGLRFTSPGIDDGDTRADQGVPADYVNLLTNPGFESDLAGWTQVNINGTVVTTAPGAHEGTKFYKPGTTEEGYIEQVVDLLGPTVTTGAIDGQDLELVFGARIRAAAETPRDRGAIEIRFLDGTNAVIGSATRVDATNTTNRWELVGGRIDIPVGARKVVYRFIADREQTSGTADAYLDGAFVYVRSEAQGTDLGAYGNTSLDTPRANTPRIELRYPDLYADLEKDKPLTIRWESFGNASESPVRVELWQDGPNGPALRAHDRGRHGRRRRIHLDSLVERARFRHLRLAHPGLAGHRSDRHRPVRRRASPFPRTAPLTGSTMHRTSTTSTPRAVSATTVTPASSRRRRSPTRPTCCGSTTSTRRRCSISTPASIR